MPHLLSRTALLLALSAALSCGNARKAEAPEKREPAPAPAPATATAVASTTTGTLFVSNEDSGDLSIVDVASGRELAKLPVGKRPRALRTSPDGSQLFVAVSGTPKAPPGTNPDTLPPPDHAADAIVVIDVATRQIARRLESGVDPEGFDLTPDGKQLWVANEEPAHTTLIDIASGKVAGHVKVAGEPEGIATHPDGKLIYVTSEAENHVDVVDVEERRVLTTIATGIRPRIAVFTRDGARAFVGNELASSVTAIDVAAQRPLTDIKIAQENARPMGLVLSPDEKTLFVATGRGKGVAAIDVATLQVTRTFDGVGARPWGIAISADGKQLYTANGASNDVSVIDVATGQIIRRIAVGKSPWGVLFVTKPAVDEKP